MFISKEAQKQLQGLFGGLCGMVSILSLEVIWEVPHRKGSPYYCTLLECDDVHNLLF